MSKVNNYVTLLLFCVILFSCQGEKTKSADGQESDKVEEVHLDENGVPLKKVDNKVIKNPDKLTVIKNMQFGIDPGRIVDMRREAKVELEEKWKASNRKSYIAVDKDLYVYVRVHDGEEMSKDGDYDGYWIDYNEDLTYVYGYKGEEKGSGAYNYDSTNNELLMLDNDEKIKPQKYDVKMVGETLIIVGEPDYKDNNYQAKLSKVTERPN